MSEGRCNDCGEALAGGRCLECLRDIKWLEARQQQRMAKVFDQTMRGAAVEALDEFEKELRVRLSRDGTGSADRSFICGRVAAYESLLEWVQCQRERVNQP